MYVFLSEISERMKQIFYSREQLVIIQPAGDREHVSVSPTQIH